MRAVYRVLATLISVGVVVQAAVIAVAWFLVLNDLDSGTVLDKNYEYNWGHVAHSTIGMMVMPLIALILLIVAFFARVRGGVKWAAITLGVTVLQVALAFVSFGAPVVGLLHGLNAFAIAGVAGVAARKARTAETSAPAQPAVVS